MALLAALHRHDRTIVIAVLVAVIALAWASLVYGVAQPAPSMGEAMMDGMNMDMAMPAAVSGWTTGQAVLILVMWMAMMAAMMLPSAVPMLLFYESIARRRNAASATVGPTAMFGLGYLAVWAGFSIAAAMLQFGFDRANLLSPAMRTTSTALAGALLVAAGLYQWTPLKQACLRQCRSPLDFVLGHWRNGAGGAFAMGIDHGLYCLGCCWMLMLLLFVGGVMSFAWIIGIALFVMVEKLAPAGHWAGKAAGLALAGWGLYTLAAMTPAM
jgi:predicted metal-binding membrane protein